jgi:hypothetical protein
MQHSALRKRAELHGVRLCGTAALPAEDHAERVARDDLQQL